MGEGRWKMGDGRWAKHVDGDHPIPPNKPLSKTNAFTHSHIRRTEGEVVGHEGGHAAHVPGLDSGPEIVGDGRELGHELGRFLVPVHPLLAHVGVDLPAVAGVRFVRDEERAAPGLGIGDDARVDHFVHAVSVSA